jgi:hypothetical protein
MMSPKLRSSLLLSVVLVVGLVGVASGGDPKTALGRWMKGNMGAPMASDTPDFGTLGASFATLAAAAPPGASYPKWTSFVQSGQAAAQKGDAAGVKGACNGCHKATAPGGQNYKDQYKADPNAPATFP